MKEKFIVISEEARTAIRTGAYDRTNGPQPGRPELTLPPGQLPRSVYTEVKTALEALGGKWNSKAQKFIFERDCLEDLVSLGETGRVLNRRQTFQEFFTPPMLAARMASTVLEHKLKVVSILEPSAGDGALVKAVLNATPFGRLIGITAVEIQPGNVEQIPNSRNVARVAADFMTWKPNIVFDAVIMNPPFAKNQWLTHVERAATFLKHGGILVAVVPSNATPDKVSVPCTIEDVDCKFEHTAIKVRLLTIVKGSKPQSKRRAAEIVADSQPPKSLNECLRDLRRSTRDIMRAMRALETELEK